MAEAIRHRGPDDFGFYHDAWAHLGQRRLSIVDIAGGHQPMSNGKSARSGSPSTVKSTTMRRCGRRWNRPGIATGRVPIPRPSCTPMKSTAWIACRLLRGMFAFAIWDAGRQRLFCARDRLGIKPFYYYWDGRLFAFASEIKALLEHPAISPALEEDLLPEVLAFGYTSGDHTLFQNIRKLMPGHRMLLDVGSSRPELKCERYWDIPMGEGAARSLTSKTGSRKRGGAWKNRCSSI